MPPQINWAYIAGIVDGEGCIRLHKRTKRKYVSYVPELTISNTSKALIEYLAETMGGCYHPRKRNNPKHSPTWDWQAPTNFVAIADILSNILPYLIVKHTQCLKLLEYCNSRISNYHKPITDEEHDMYTIMRPLNSRGEYLCLQQ